MADNKDKKVLNVPHLRFPEFSGEWEKVTLKEVADFSTTNNKASINSGTIIHVNISPSNIFQCF